MEERPMIDRNDETVDFTDEFTDELGDEMLDRDPLFGTGRVCNKPCKPACISARS